MIRPAVAALLALLLAPASAAAQPSFERVVDGLGFAVNAAFATDGRIFYVEKDLGQIRVVRDGEVRERPFATVAADSDVNEMGLLGIALHPSFPDEPWVYAYYSDAELGRNRLVRFRADGDVAVERQDLLDLLPTTNGWHNGGDLAFGPDGKLYVAVGEGHDGSLAQDPEALGGRILRLEPDGSVPPDNPLGPDNPTFALGIRNSFGICFDPESGDLWSTDNGPDEWDEINRMQAGGNYGWPEHLGPGGPSSFIEPVLAFEEPIVVTGCAGSPADGGLYFGEGYSGALHRMQVPDPGDDDPTPTDEIVAEFDGGVTDVALGTDGALWVVTPNAIYRSTGDSVEPTSSPVGTGTPSRAAGQTEPSDTASASPAGGSAGALGTGAGIALLLLLAGAFLWLRGRALRR